MAQATAMAETRLQPDRRATEPQRLRRLGISPRGELLMQWLSFRRRRPRRRPPCPCRQPWTSSWQERPIRPTIPPAKFLTQPNKNRKSCAPRRRILASRFLVTCRAASSVRPMPWVKKQPTFESDPKGSPGTVLPLQTVQRAPPASGRWCVLGARARLALAVAVSGRSSSMRVGQRSGNRRSTSGSSLSGMKPRRCQNAAASGSMALTRSARPPTSSAAITQRCSACLTRPVPMPRPAQPASVASCPSSRQGTGSGGWPVRMDRARRHRPRNALRIAIWRRRLCENPTATCRPACGTTC